MKKVPILNTVGDYKDLYKGERCFIVGNGPSLNNTDLTKLKNEYSFGINQVNIIYPKTEWRPSIFCSFSSKWNKNPKWRDNIIQSMDLGVPTFLFKDADGKPIDKTFIKDNHNPYFLKVTGTHDCNPNDDNQWSTNITDRVTKNGTTLMAVVQIAIYMGFSDIYLIGCDLGYGSGTTHFNSSYLPPQGSQYNTWVTKSHKLIKRMTKDTDVNVYNATVGGHLEVHPRVEYNSLFK